MWKAFATGMCIFFTKNSIFSDFLIFLERFRTRWWTRWRTHSWTCSRECQGHVRENIRDTFERISWTCTRTRLSRFLRQTNDKFSALATGIRVWGTCSTDCSGHVHGHVHGRHPGHVHGRFRDTFDWFWGTRYGHVHGHVRDMFEYDILKFFLSVFRCDYKNQQMRLVNGSRTPQNATKNCF